MSSTTTWYTKPDIREAFTQTPIPQELSSEINKEQVSPSLARDINSVFRTDHPDIAVDPSLHPKPTEPYLYKTLRCKSRGYYTIVSKGENPRNTITTLFAVEETQTAIYFKGSK